MGKFSIELTNGMWADTVVLVDINGVPISFSSIGGSVGLDGKTILSGVVAPINSQGTDGDYFLNTATSFFYGPKASGAWPAPVSLIGPAGKTLLSGTVAPASGTGNDGDFYINTVTSVRYGPKAGGAWPAGVSMIGPAGNTVLNGAGAPASGLGANGDFYIDTTAKMMYGPKSAGAWGAGVTTAGPPGSTFLSGTVAPTSGQGIDGDYYINTLLMKLYGPKAAGTWPATGNNLRGRTVNTGITSHRISGPFQQLAAGGGVTYDNVVSCKVPFYAARVMLRNYDTTGPITVIGNVTSQAVASSSGTTLTWLPLTKNGSTSITIPAAVAVPNSGAPLQIIPGMVSCDVSLLSSLARTDGGTLSLFRLRLYSTSFLYVTTINTELAGWLETGDYCPATRATADNVTNANAAMTPNTSAGATTMVPYGQIDFYTQEKAARIVVTGDSLNAGGNFTQPGGAGNPYTGGNMMNWCTSMRKAFADIGLPQMQVAPLALGGQKRDITNSIFNAFYADYKADIAIIWNYSVNGAIDGSTGTAGHFKYLFQEIAACRDKGMIPVVATMHGSNFIDTNATLTAMAKMNVTVLDFANLMATSSTNPVINPAYTYDGTHSNAVGAAVMAAYAAPILASLL